MGMFDNESAEVPAASSRVGASAATAAPWAGPGHNNGMHRLLRQLPSPQGRPRSSVRHGLIPLCDLLIETYCGSVDLRDRIL